ncbi:MAG TPA: hypothetical protein VFU06_01700 [Longimicrobiales bacterium]|nr:hypothetical protein [Longimicrobiales bacterium]
MSQAAGSASAGSVHGFSVHSRARFNYLRSGGGEPLLVRENGSPPDQVGSFLAQRTSRNGAVTHIYERNGTFSVDVEGIGWFVVDSTAGSIEVPPWPEPAWLEAEIWGLPAALLVLARGGLLLHASAVEVDGRVVILTGPSHHGKTTLAGALSAAGHRLLSEDLIRLDVGTTTPRVYPGPAVLRLRRDVARWLDVPGAREVAADAEKVHLALEPAQRGTCDPLPLAGIVLLHRGSTLAMERLEPVSMIQDLWAISLNLPTSEGRARCFNDITHIAESVPIWKLVRPLTRESLPDVMNLVIEAGRAP